MEYLRSVYTEAVSRISADVHRQKEEAFAQYGKTLDAIMATQKQNGDIEGYLIVDKEAKRFQNAKAVTNIPNTYVVDAVLLCQKQIFTAELDQDRKMNYLAKQYKDALTGLIRDLMAQNKIDDAKDAGTERTSVEFLLVALELRLPKEEPQVTVEAPRSPVPQMQTQSLPSEGATLRVSDIEVEALIDGLSELHITTGGIYWVSRRRASKPGRHKGRHEPTIVNGTEWYPTWGNPDEYSNDRTEIYSMNIRSINFFLSLKAVSTDRGGKGIDKRDPIDRKGTDDEYVVSIPDPQAGSRWYRFILRGR